MNDETVPIWVKTVTAVVCILSILGAVAIILTYALVKDIRSKARELIVNISVMDIIYSTANFVGLMLPYHEHLSASDTVVVNSSSLHDTYLRICRAQAFCAAYGTIGSVLWTLGLAVYLYYRIVSRDATIYKRLVKVLYVVCYTLPLYVSLWLLLGHYLGYSPYAQSGAGWCFVNQGISAIELFMTYDIWMWLGMITLIPLYLTIHVHIRQERKRHYLMTDNPVVLMQAERKLLLIPLMFLVLRIWDIGSDIFIVYEDYHGPVNKWVKLFTAIGDSGQGLVNFVIYFLFQPRLRALLINTVRYCCCCCCLDHWRQVGTTEERYSDEEEEDGDGVMRAPHSKSFSQHTPSYHNPRTSW